MVGVTKIQRGNAGYWLAAVAEGGDDYYNKPGEAPGEWIGELAADLGLSGQVDAEGYSAILEGRNPTSGDQLVKRPDTRYRKRADGTEKRVEPVLGFDVRFSAPKSVSILYALGDEATRERVLAVMNEAVRQGLSHLEHEACFVQRGKGGERLERGEGFTGMAFRHRMSRAGDPALHVHVVISNLTRAVSDGKWLSLASPKGRSPLWPHGKSAGVVFQAALRSEFLREFGLEFEAVTNGYADLKGFGRDVIEALSTRSREIAAWTEQHGVDTIAAKQTAAYRTRDKKDYGVDEDDRRGEWIEQTAPFGITPESVAGMVANARPREPRQVGDAALDAALAKLEDTSSHFDRRALLWAIGDQLPEGADLPAITAAVDRLLATDRIICVYASDDPLDFDYYTTPRIAELERHFIDGALGGTDAGVAEVSPATLAAALERHPYLDADQRQMVVRLTTSGEQVVPVAAWPGTGKTTSLKAAKESWDADGFPVIGCATARTASGELIDAGISNATSIRALLNRTDKLREEGVMPLARGTVIIVDEASTTSTPDLEALRFLAVECEGKLVVIGDPKQIGAVGPGGLYGYLTRAVKATTLTIIHRQRREEDRQLIALVYEGRGSEALDLLRTRGQLIVADDLPAALDGMLADWHHDFATGADAVMIARRNHDVDDLNHQARELRREQGALGVVEVIVGERAFAAGDRVQTRLNREGVTNRERWDVTGADAAARTITLRRVGGDERTVTLGAAYLDRRTDNGGPALEYAYALTKFGAQGKTVDRAYPLLDSGASLEQELVALSRGREVANVYTVASSELTDADLGPGRREVSDELHDIRAAIEREGNEYAAAEAPMRKRIENLSSKVLAERRAELIVAARAADPQLSRRDRLERAIKDGEEWVSRLAREREAIEAMKHPPADELARVRTGEAAQAEQLRRDLAELARLPEPTPTTEPNSSLDPITRLEAVLVEATIERNARREVRASQLDPTQIIYDTLGPFPASDPAKAFAWGDAANTIATYRHRYDVHDESHPLGQQPRGAAARAERARAQRRIENAQRRLGRAADHGAQRAVSNAPTIGR
ncbi:MAG TPA: MobF family relaxase [Solirubrobacterales bacterium]|jgi:conjugative relaxase-like TrwC/TraI family protein